MTEDVDVPLTEQMFLIGKKERCLVRSVGLAATTPCRLQLGTVLGRQLASNLANTVPGNSRSEVLAAGC